MKKIFIFFGLTFLLACASTKSQRVKTSLDFDSVKNVVSQSPSQKQILEKFGEPNRKEKDGASERWRYFDPGTDFDRVTLVFNEQKKLTQLTWLPVAEDPYRKISTIFIQYPKGSFKHVTTRRISHDCLATETSYVSDSMGILHDDSLKEVEAVLWYMPRSVREVPDNKSTVTSR